MSNACTPILVGMAFPVSDIKLAFKIGHISLSDHGPWMSNQHLVREKTGMTLIICNYQSQTKQLCVHNFTNCKVTVNCQTIISLFNKTIRTKATYYST